HSAGSQFWKSIQAIKKEIRLGLRFSVGNGSGPSFGWTPGWRASLSACGSRGSLRFVTTRPSLFLRLLWMRDG
uniref:Uncharacterized protein n=1 Tax=Aegilops tauschii subsp. strangulata TaxID=200361 RepID=A0A453QWT7_AEGTS